MRLVVGGGGSSWSSLLLGGGSLFLAVRSSSRTMLLSIFFYLLTKFSDKGIRDLAKLGVCLDSLDLARRDEEGGVLSEQTIGEQTDVVGGGGQSFSGSVVDGEIRMAWVDVLKVDGFQLVSIIGIDEDGSSHPDEPIGQSIQIVKSLTVDAELAVEGECTHVAQVVVVGGDTSLATVSADGVDVLTVTSEVESELSERVVIGGEVDAVVGE